MPTNEPDLETVIHVPNDMDAAIVVNLLQENGIQAVAEGGFTAGFQAEAPGDVAVRVKPSDLQAAQEILAEAHGNEPPTG